MFRLCSILIFASLFASSYVDAQGDKGKKKPPEKKKQPVLCTIELKDGTTLQGNYLSPEEIIIEIADGAPFTLKLESVRFLDCEAERHRIGTYKFDSIIGKIETDEFTFQVVTTNAEMTFRRDRIKRIVFPDPPRGGTLLGP